MVFENPIKSVLPSSVQQTAVTVRTPPGLIPIKRALSMRGLAFARTKRRNVEDERAVGGP